MLNTIQNLKLIIAEYQNYKEYTRIKIREKKFRKLINENQCNQIQYDN